MLLNTAVHHPDGMPIPAPLRLAGARGVLAASTVATTAFLDTTLALASPSLDAATKAAYRAPYRSPERRGGIGGFVADIPVDARHESRAELERIAAGVAALDVPALLLWGPRTRSSATATSTTSSTGCRTPTCTASRAPATSSPRTGRTPERCSRGSATTRDRAARARARRSPRAAAVAERPTTPTFVPIWHGLDDRRDDDASRSSTCRAGVAAPAG